MPEYSWPIILMNVKFKMWNWKPTFKNADKWLKFQNSSCFYWISDLKAVYTVACCSMFSAIFHNPPRLSHLCVQIYFSIITMTLLSPHLSPSPYSSSHHLLFSSTNSLSSFHCLSLPLPLPLQILLSALISPSLSSSLPRLLSPSLSRLSLFFSHSVTLCCSLVLAMSCNIMWAECQVFPMEQTGYV